MTPVRIGKPQTPYSVRGLEGTFDVLFALVLGKGTDLLLETEKHEPRSVTIVNKFSGKALEVENSSVHQGAPARQVAKPSDFGRLFYDFPQPVTRSSQIIAGYVWTSRTARWTKLWPYSNSH
jgi:hypothetical protein